MAALAGQTLDAACWEALLVDNASTSFPEIEEIADVAPPNLRRLSEARLGLTHARACGFAHARAELAVLVDDDNVLDAKYLEHVVRLFDSNAAIGIIGGKSIPEFEVPPPAWAHEFLPLLAVRDIGEAALVSSGLQAGAYPAFAPIGAGMAIRRRAWEAWLKDSGSRVAVLSDRRGRQLTSGGDNDIVICAMRAGWEVAYFPELSLRHLIPPSRLEPDYLARLNRGIQRSWMEVLSVHGLNPWPPISRFGAALRKSRAWITYRGWVSPLGRIRWHGACGHFEGRTQA